MEPDRHGGRTLPARPGRSTGLRAAAALVALVAGAACLIGAGIILVRQAVDARSEAIGAPSPVDTVPAATTTTAAPEPLVPSDVDLTEMVEVVDDSGTLSVFVPAGWSDVATSAWTEDGSPVGVRINAAPDRAAWFEGWGTPGVFVGATTVFDADRLAVDFGGVCVFEGRRPFRSEALIGSVETWVDCSSEGSELLVIVAEPDDGSYVLLIQVIVVDEADRAGLDAVVSTVRYLP
jgi:hypothetical protein